MNIGQKVTTDSDEELLIPNQPNIPRFNDHPQAPYRYAPINAQASDGHVGQYPGDFFSQPQLVLPPQPPFPYSSGASVHPIVVVGQPAVVIGQPRASYTCHIVLSCFVFWCCGWLFGAIALGLAVGAKSLSDSGDAERARRLGKASITLSIIGIIVPVVLIIILVTLELHYNTGFGYQTLQPTATPIHLLQTSRT